MVGYVPLKQNNWSSASVHHRYPTLFMISRSPLSEPDSGAAIIVHYCRITLHLISTCKVDMALRLRLHKTDIAVEAKSRLKQLHF